MKGLPIIPKEYLWVSGISVWLPANSKSCLVTVARPSRLPCIRRRTPDAGGTIHMQLDHEPTPEQWEALKALRAPASMSSAVNSLVIDELVALGFAMTRGGLAVITPSGRKVLVRGSPRLLDVAA
jgi:hypothetical protein